MMRIWREWGISGYDIKWNYDHYDIFLDGKLVGSEETYEDAVKEAERMKDAA